MPAHIDYVVATPVALPPECGVANVYETVHFADAFAILLPAEASRNPEELARFIFSNQPAWIRQLMQARDAIVSCFGLKTARHLAEVGKDVKAERVGIFRIYGQDKTEIVMGEDDKHLDFRLSVLWSAASAPDVMPRLTVSTVVHCHNLLGRAYIAAIAPLNRMVVKACLRRAANIGWPRAACPDSHMLSHSTANGRLESAQVHS